jgi:uncharacterized protein (DUF885 family)
MTEDNKLYELAEDYLRKYLELNPVMATYLGIHEYDDQMPRGDKKGVEEYKELLIDFETSLGDINEDRLSYEAKIDYQLARDTIRIWLFYIDDWPKWRMYPFGPETIGGALFPLYIRDFAPFQSRFASITSRLLKSSRFLEETRECLEDPVEVFIETALITAKQIPLFAEIIVKTGETMMGREDPLVKKAYEASNHLKETFTSYISWLYEIKTEARDDFAIGKERFEKLLQMRGLGMSSDEILKLGEHYLHQFKEEAIRLADQIMPKTPIEKVRIKIEEEHPDDFKSALEEYKKSIIEAKKFVIEKNIAPLPPVEDVIITETPPFLTPVIPFAAYIPPAPFEEKKTGVYMITPPQRQEQLRRHNYYAISNTSVHEAYPGHHLQLSWSATIRNLLRLMSENTEFVEGWAHYCEDLMKEYGYDDTPKHRFVQIIDSIWRAARIIIDVKLSRGEMGFDEAVDFLVKETGMDKEAAEAEVRRYTFTPGYQLSYLLGKHLLKELRKEVKSYLGEKYNDYEFHKVVLESGGMPYKYLRKLVFTKLGVNKE